MNQNQQQPTKTRDEIFMERMPDSLYMNHYELSLHFGHTPEEWRQFLRDNDKFIMKEVAAITEAEARKALQKLSTGKLSAQEVSAIKQILDRSEQINKQSQDARTFVTTFMPQLTPDQEEQMQVRKQYINEQKYILNQQKVTTIYNPNQEFYERIQKGEIKVNEDGSLAITNPSTREDYLYLGIEIPSLET